MKCRRSRAGCPALEPERTARASIVRKERFAFGRNWRRFVETIDEESIASAADSLKSMLRREELNGVRFLDAGSGSGLFSLAAFRLGAEVVSVDFDEESVNCTRMLKERLVGSTERWRIEAGSVLDTEYLESLGNFDIVYSWGVLHHTGSMWKAIDSVCRVVGEQGILYIAIYNDQRWLSSFWLLIKRVYNKYPAARPALVIVFWPYLVAARFVIRAINGRRLERGMSLWYDMVDWLGGLPFEVASPGEIVDFMFERGFALRRLRTCGGRSGCNEYLFSRDSC